MSVTPPPEHRSLYACPPTPQKSSITGRYYHHGVIDSISWNGRTITFDPCAIGEGAFCTVHLVIAKEPSSWVIKLPQANRTESDIQECRRNASAVYNSVIERGNLLTEKNIGVIQTIFTGASTGYAILQPQIHPLCSSMKVFSPPWKTDVKPVEELCPESQKLLKTVKEAFALFLKHNLVVDFKPDNVTWDGTTLSVFDFHEKEDEFRMIVRSLLENWAQNNPHIFHYLDPRS